MLSREKFSLRVFDNRVLRREYRLKSYKNREYRRFYNEEIHNLYYSSNIVRVIKYGKLAKMEKVGGLS